ncbi:hypothetical protein TrCOL_g6457 [Triparma columacea]|uniref:Uncharacterized protein n=1 Tax=Triparma columacea TaxID=722753 RepID=A0A9W7GIG2_9STRA|nr:hypothetical protein TrCOL_g6457 [Triparma columacea]
MLNKFFLVLTSPQLLLFPFLLTLPQTHALDSSTSTIPSDSVVSGRVSVQISGFGDDVARSHDCQGCPSTLISHIDESPLLTAERFCSSDPGCVDSVSKEVADAHLVAFYQLSTELDDHLKAEGVNMTAVEGKSHTYLDKVRLMKRLAQHEEVYTVCEVGFNAGHSALLWLASGVRRVLSFELGQYPYSAKAISWLSKRYSGRFQVVMGDSLESVPAFHKMWPEERCNLLFVDGGHRYQHATGDLENFRQMRNESFHFLLVDDTNQAEVAMAWRDYKDRGLAREEEVVWSDYSEDLYFNSTGSLAPHPDGIIHEWRSSISYGLYV